MMRSLSSRLNTESSSVRLVSAPRPRPWGAGLTGDAGICRSVMAALRKSLVLADPNRCEEPQLPVLTAFRYERTVVMAGAFAPASTLVVVALVIPVIVALVVVGRTAEVVEAQGGPLAVDDLHPLEHDPQGL